ncbi:MAG: hypothetical protein PHI97_02280 [Desulfobulbus sp.]|nr:hypothetical protein [Desulfobulbus sp.]
MLEASSGTRKVLLINPSVSLYDSVSALDLLMVENFPGGMEKFDLCFRDALVKLASVTMKMRHTQLSGELLCKADKRPSPSEENLATLIGLSFLMGR